VHTPHLTTTGLLSLSTKIETPEKWYISIILNLYGNPWLRRAAHKTVGLGYEINFLSPIPQASTNIQLELGDASAIDHRTWKTGGVTTSEYRLLIVFADFFRGHPCQKRHGLSERASITPPTLSYIGICFFFYSRSHHLLTSH
jgi:hypothetical protein